MKYIPGSFVNGVFLFLFSGVVSCLFLAGLNGCEKKSEPIRIGFVGGLTGRLSDLGIAGRNGVILAVEEVNASGGIHGRRVELVIRDDRQDPEVALQVDRELIQEGVTAIIGHMTSSMTTAVLPLINKRGMVMISPTTSTNELTGIDDQLLRVIVPNRQRIEQLALHARKKLGLEKIAIVYDLSNRDYTEDYYRIFKKSFEGMDGKIVAVSAFTSGPDVHFLQLIGELLESQPDGMLIIAGALDTAMICQRIRKAGSMVPLLSSGWAMTGDLISQGGRAVEGAIFIDLLDKKSTKKTYVDFSKKFMERFGELPGFAAMCGYEAATVLLSVLSEDKLDGDLKTAILKKKKFRGVQGDFEIDPFGDAKRNLFLVTVRNGQFQTVE